MAIVRKLEKVQLEREAKHSEVKCTYSVVSDSVGDKFLQIDTYGSAAIKANPIGSASKR